jgi:mannose-6-phosphate isomerase-like protein (cupin superfamily)
MRLVASTLSLVFVILATPWPTTPQTPEATSKTFCSASEVNALIAAARSQRKEGQAIVLEPLLKLGPYTTNLEYRASVGNAAVHEKEAEIIYVIEGSGTITLGGTLVGGTRQNPSNLTGTGINGGAAQHLAKGDFLIVPENTPHWVSSIDGTLVLASVHVPLAD